MTNKKIKQIISKLSNFELDIRNVPNDVKNNKKIIEAERQLGIRITKNRGFDVIRQIFFVEEDICYKNGMGEFRSVDNYVMFDTFETYYDYLDGDIYDLACYSFLDYKKYEHFIEIKNIDVSKMKERKTFLSKNIDDEVIEVTERELDIYKMGENNKKKIKKWIKSFASCKSGKELSDVVQKYNKSQLSEKVNVRFFFYIYIFQDINDEIRFNTIMEYMCTGKYPSYEIINSLILIYNSEKVIENYDYQDGTKQTRNKHKRKLKEFVARINNGEIELQKYRYFDNITHFFCEEVIGIYTSGRCSFPIYARYFENFEQFIRYTKGDIKGADLSGAMNLNIDFSKYQVDEKTKIPICAKDNLKCLIKKEYQDEKFVVHKKWTNEKGALVKENIFKTKYFFDFIYYLNNDLSGAFLLFCDGLRNVQSLKGINLNNVKMKSELCDRFGISYEKFFINENTVDSFESVKKNEQETLLETQKREDVEQGNSYKHITNLMMVDNQSENFQRIYYISDIHIMHKLKQENCKSLDDIKYVLKKIVNNIAKETGSLLLIGGDVSSDFEIFKLFVRLLRKRLSNKYFHVDVVYILGNHELWPFPNTPLIHIIEKYKQVIEENGMYLLQNELLYKKADNRLYKISYNELMSKTIEEIRKQIESTRLVILGGIGFSGYNNEFNANQGIYRNTLSRKQEIDETYKFEKMYGTVLPCIKDKNTIILTHMPKKDWCQSPELYKDFVYVNGHTHRNEFYDDGYFRIYADNQVGYKNRDIYLKNFLLDNEYDCFSDYNDGIHEISAMQYNDFYRGKNIRMNFTRETNILYMLKKKGYYCFIHKAKSNSLAILNGGSLKKLTYKDIYFYYEHMDEMIANIKNPLEKYMSIQHQVSEEVKKIGGIGDIHGCIVDIDWYNHIYVNPVDLTMTGYWASNMVNKKVYPSVLELLKKKCPLLYSNCMKLIVNEQENFLALSKSLNSEISLLPQDYLGTDIYKASREIKKIQKLTSNILSWWNDDLIQTYKGIQSKSV